MIKLAKTMFVMLLLVLIMSNYVSALGVTPARRVVNFEPGQTYGYEFNVLNSEGKEQLLAVYAVGDLAEYVTLDRNIIGLKAEDSKAVVKLSVKMPDDFEPGTAKTNIMIASLPNDAGIKDDIQGEVYSGNLNSNIGANIVVAHQLWVEVPYPGKFIRAKLRNQQYDGKPEFVVALFNLGSENIEAVNARIEVLGATFEELAELRTNTVAVAPGTESKISAVWNDADVQPGVYRVRAVIEYDGKTIVLEDNFYVGESNVEIKGLTVNSFRLGTIAKLNLLVESNWNNPISEVYGEFDVQKSGSSVSNFLTAPTKLDPYHEETLIGYWDTEGFEIGKYDVLVKVHYQGKTEERIYDAVVSVDSIDFSGGVAAGRVTGSDGDSSPMTLIIILMFVLVGLNVALFLYIRRGKK